ncbi:hypothetical protein Ancab_022775, partial [Ancistrocladus abbreviatus]
LLYAWDIRFLVLLSLFIQTFLGFLAPMRKCTSSLRMAFFIWVFYLLADGVAIFTIGLISNTQDTTPSSSSSSAYPPTYTFTSLHAFWATFLLLHLGGLDSITALAVQDNSLWQRHLLQHFAQVVAILYVIFQAITLKTLHLWPAVVLMFVAGLFRCAERILSLYVASMDNFRNSLLCKPDPGLNYAKLMWENSSRKPTKHSMEFQMRTENEEKNDDLEAGDGYGGHDHYNPNKLDDMKMTYEAYKFLMKFKGIIIDQIFSLSESDDSRKYFLKFKENVKEAFRIIEIELNFMYDIFYTKVVLRNYLHIYVMRIVSLCCIAGGLLLFHFKYRQNFKGVEVGITYMLLWGAITPDTVAFLKLYFFSSWTIATWIIKGKSEKTSNSRYSFVEESVRKINNLLYKFPRPKILRRRWSESMPQYNLLDYSLKEHAGPFTRCLYMVGFEDLIIEVGYVTKQEFTDPLRNFIFEELRAKSEMAVSTDDTKKISTSRGASVLENDTVFKALVPKWITDVNYEESLLLWHIATDLLYNVEKGPVGSHESKRGIRQCLPCLSEMQENSSTDTDNAIDYADCSRILSNYMVYLLIMRPTLMSPVADIAHIRFQDTCAETKRLLSILMLCHRQI